METSHHSTFQNGEDNYTFENDVLLQKSKKRKLTNEPKIIEKNPLSDSDLTIRRKALKKWKIKPQNNEGIAVPKPKRINRDNGLFYSDYVIGNGAEPLLGKKVGIIYEGLLFDGTVFDTHLRRTQPFVFRKGTAQVIRGLDLGIQGMRIGGSREIVVPSHLGYGAEGLCDRIPKDATLIFRVTLVNSY